VLNTGRMASWPARTVLAAAFLLGHPSVLVAVADVPVAQAKPQHAISGVRRRRARTAMNLTSRLPSGSSRATIAHSSSSLARHAR
jgi:selenophosphate synthetase-related protein